MDGKKKKVLITGGNGDIAQAIKVKLENEGYKVYAPSRQELDVTDKNNVEKSIREFVPDVLINNAGMVVPQSVRKADLDLTKQHINVNLLGLFYCSELGLKYNPELVIVNIGSAAAIETHATWSEYCATKAAVVMATKCWAEDGIYAVVLSPGRTKTKMRKSLYPNENQSTLLEPQVFAEYVFKAVKKDYLSGTHVVVKKESVRIV